jgi:hypothetical protein
MLNASVCEYARDLAKYTNFNSAPLNFICIISVCFYNYSPHPKPPVFGSSNVCVLHDKATECFLIFTEIENTCFLCKS